MTEKADSEKYPAHNIIDLVAGHEYYDRYVGDIVIFNNVSHQGRPLFRRKGGNPSDVFYIMSWTDRLIKLPARITAQDFKNDFNRENASVA